MEIWIWAKHTIKHIALYHPNLN